MTARSIEAELERVQAVRQGHFLLSSGLHSAEVRGR